MKSDTQDQGQPPLAPADGSAIIDVRPRRQWTCGRQWTCDQCGSTGHWDINWSAWGSILEADEAGRRIVVCSERCRAAADPETLWVRKYGEPPRTFKARPGSGMAVPIKRKRRTISVRLVPDDWQALVHFVTSDLHNMEDSEIKEQLTRILDSIQRSVALSPNTVGSGTPEVKP